MTRFRQRTGHALVLPIAVNEEAHGVTRPRAAPTRASVVAIALSVGWLLGAVGAAPASAHASLVRSSPADQSSLATAPTTVTLTFDENIRTPSVVLVTNADGASVVQGKTTVVDNISSTPVSTGPSGEFTVAYRVVSADGHPVSGRLAFSVGPGRPGAPTPQVTAAVGHHQGSNTSTGGSRVIGMIAALALLGGVGLLTVRRWAPNLWSSQ
jgi:copper resistance protein C